MGTRPACRVVALNSMSCFRRHIGLIIPFLVLLTGTAQAASSIASASGGKVRAVVIGIDTYQNFNSLRGAKADATDLADSLGSGGAQVTTLYDDKASRADVVAAMDRLVTSSRPGDLAVVAFAGHGTRVPEYDFPGWKGIEPGGMNEEFVLSAYARSGPGAGEVVVNKEMKTWLTRLDAKGVDVLFVADTCFGGGLVRGYDPRTKFPTIRGVPPIGRGEKGRFKPIAMTMAELLTTVADLKHVTFLGGADSMHEVPEVSIPGEPGPRGALSYSLAHMFRGEGEASNNGGVTRKTMFQQVLQLVNQYTDGQQDVDREPKTLDPVVLDQTVFRLTASTKTQITPAEPATLPIKEKSIGVDFIHGDGSAMMAMMAVSPPFHTTTQATADVVWDLGTKEVVIRGDVVRRNAEEAEFPGILYRTVAVDFIKKLSEPRLMTVRLEQGGVEYTSLGSQPTFHAPDVTGRDLVVIDLTSIGVLQVLYPNTDQDPTVADSDWSLTSQVVGPFGADQVIVISAPKGLLKKFADWAWSQDQRTAAAILPDRLQALVDEVPGVRMGTVDLVTSP